MPVRTSEASLVERLDRSEVDLIVISAPAGFGKTTLATLLFQRRQNRALCDAAVPELIDLAKATITALAEEAGEGGYAITEARASFGATDSSGWTELARRLWSRAVHSPSAFVFDNLEVALARPAFVTFLGGLLASRPDGRRVILCSRVPLPKDLTRHALPHRTEWVRAADLRMPSEQISALLEPLALDAGIVQEAIRISQGWPIAVLLILRLAREGQLEVLIPGHQEMAVDALIEYLSREYFDSVPQKERTLLITVVALPNASIEEAAGASGLSIDACEEFVRLSPFVRKTNDDQLEPHPLLRALVSSRHRRDLLKIADKCIADAAQGDDFIRGAEIAISWGQEELAADLLSHVPREVAFRSLSRIVPIVGEIAIEELVNRPALWLATIEMRRSSLRPEDLLAEARRVLDGLAPTAEPRLRTEVLLEYIVTLTNAGRLTEAIAALRTATSEVRDEDLRRELQFMQLAVDSYQGRLAKAHKALDRATEDLEKLGSYTRLLDVVEACTALRGGHYERGMMLLDKAARISRESGFVSRLLINLSNVASEAWLVRDEARFDQAVAEMKNSLVPGLDRAWTYWLAAALGDEAAEPTGYEALGTVATGHLFIAIEGQGPERVLRLRRAIEAADRANDIYLRIFARIASAELDAGLRPEVLTDLRELARQVDVPEFAAGVNAYVEGRPGLGPVGMFVTRRLRAQPEHASGILVDLLSGQIRRSNLNVDVTARELALMTLLAVSGRVVRRDALCDQLWPDQDGDSAANNLKGVVHRIRRKLHEGAILSMHDGYSLGPDVTVNLSDAEQTVRGAASTKPTEADLKRLSRILTTLRSRSSGDLLRYDWYVALDHRLQELFRETALVLGRVANERRRFETTLQLAAELLRADAADESAFQILLDSYAGMGNLNAARRALEEFENACRSQRDELPSRRMRLKFERLSRDAAVPTMRR